MKFLLYFLGSSDVGDDDLWYHRILGTLCSLFFGQRPRPLTPDSEALPAGVGGLPAGSEALPAGSEDLPAGSKSHGVTAP